MEQKIRLTKSVREIMDILWKQKEVLTSSEIIKASLNNSWSNTSIHLLLSQSKRKEVPDEKGNFKKIFF